MIVDLGLDGPLATADITARMDHGTRTLRFHVTTAGRFGRNAFDEAWITVKESSSWSGEARYVLAERRMPDDDERVIFTDAGREHIRAALVPAINRYGFSRLWDAIYMTGRSPSYRSRITEAEGEADWWRDLELLEMAVSSGMAEFVAVLPDPGSYMSETQVCVVDIDRRIEWTAVSAEVRVGGERMGWITTRGRLVPVDDRLRAVVSV